MLLENKQLTAKIFVPDIQFLHSLNPPIAFVSDSFDNMGTFLIYRNYPK